MHAQLSSAQLCIGQQRSAAPCGAVRCGAVPCPAVRCCVVLRCVVLRCALFRAYSSIRYETKYQVPGTGMYVLCTRLFPFSSVDLSRSPRFFPHADYTRTADQTVTPSTSTQHSTRQLLCTSSSWHYQFAVCIKSWASSFSPLYIF